ncbi:chemotaxis protein CheW [[Limnothrix rosea] IAM M-220]|uniref:chemotaxis protein CheW n=1 Tax=[Limnothrix rosea] IAM M-220 TaxID=454133 RepID=UPI0009607F1F|nr:chemotaxis protein CheW [[Limnothrix rosea] IAM M-220]OKH19216.1 hypothetical protein NIES208_02900 [[Limnothrix rosea] IAM M-220]
MTTDYFQVRLYPRGAAPGLGRSRLLIPLGDIAEIVTVQQQEICALPGVPQGVTGVFNLRGQLIWTMDLRQMNRTWVSESRLNPQGKVMLVLVTSSQGQVGCIAQELFGIATCDSAAMVGITPDLRRAYVFCDRQIEQDRNTTGVVIDTGQLFRHLSLMA